MEITLDRNDLMAEYQEINCSRTRFEHFGALAQRVIVLAGKATFKEFDGSNYNAIYAPADVSEETEVHYVEYTSNRYTECGRNWRSRAETATANPDRVNCVQCLESINRSIRKDRGV